MKRFRAPRALVGLSALTALGLASAVTAATSVYALAESGGQRRTAVELFVPMQAWRLMAPGPPADRPTAARISGINQHGNAPLRPTPRVTVVAETHTKGTDVLLLGFRARASFCLTAQVQSRIVATSCVTDSTLQRLRAPAIPLLLDYPGTKGRVAVTFGFADSSVTQIRIGIVNGQTRVIPVHNNTFLFATTIIPSERVDELAAVSRGRSSSLPLVAGDLAPRASLLAVVDPALSDFLGPTEVSSLSTGHISLFGAPRVGSPWLVRDSALRAEGRVKFARLLAPSPAAISVGIQATAPTRADPAPLICVAALTPLQLAAVSSTCHHREGKRAPAQVIQSRAESPSNLIVSVVGVLPDQVKSGRIYFLSGDSTEVAVRNNTFVIELLAAELPAKLAFFGSVSRPLWIRLIE